MQLNITKITIIKGDGSHYIYLTTDLPSAVWPFRGNADMILHCAYGTAEEYCKKNFPGVPVEIIEGR